MKIFLLKYRFTILFTTLGVLAGILYWHFVGCASGTCPITSHWYTMGGYGLMMGWLVGEIFRTKAK